MKKYIVSLLLLSGIVLLNACKDDEKDPGSPVLQMDSRYSYEQALFADSIPFLGKVSDEADIPLSTLKAQLFFDEEMVSETVIRTKTSGEYGGKIYVPFLKNIPNGTAKLKFVLQNIHFSITEQVYNIVLTRPDYTELRLVAEDGSFSYPMVRTGQNEYALTTNFPQKVKAFIQAPAMGELGKALTFGWEDNEIALDGEEAIPFSNLVAGEYTISFNTFSLKGEPFLIPYAVNGELMKRIDDQHFYIDVDFTQNGKVSIEGIDELGSWWIDKDYLTTNGDGTFSFVPISGKYKVTADFEHEYLLVEPLNASGSDYASLQSDGTGAIWTIGEGLGKPSYTANQVGWNDKKAISLAPIGNKKYQLTLEAGKTLNAESINFKFYSTKLDWGGEFKNDRLTTTSDLVFVGAGEEPGPGNSKRDPGNLGLLKGKTFEKGASYVFIVDVSAGNDKAVLTVTKK